MKNFVNLYVKDAMTTDLITVSPDTKLKEVEGHFEAHDYNFIPVMEKGRMVGIVSKLDILKHFVFTPQSMIPHYDRLLEDEVRLVMNKGVLTVSTDTPLTRVLELMVETKLRSFPVVDGEMNLLGIISRDDILRQLRE